ncbi:MAG: hypothetical protein MUF49_25230 [Oculatellaceae cyanobacterium Prado106]|jgi:threonine/homoserine/homoserine lactone efflux protein|nr:hypothetical protein [Oculatellaceae cyanobacterium Prado106]
MNVAIADDKNLRIKLVGIEFVWFALVAMMVSQEQIKRGWLAIAHWFERLMGGVLILLGFRLALSSTQE